MLLAEAGASGYKVDAALGQKLMDYKHLCAEFERVRFTHAFPARKQQPRFRPVRAPLSLVKAGDAIHDAAGREKPFLIQGKAPVFQIDWKKEDRKGLEQFGWESLETELRVRTAIDPETLRADDEKLFAYEMVKPDGFEWLGSVDLSKVTIAKAEVAKELATLLSAGLAGLGKTKANVRIECGTKLFEPKIKSRPAATGTQWRITLMTPAILCDPAGISRSSGNGEELLEAYRKWWWKLSGETLELKRFFASQTLAGGYYLFKQFQKTKKEYRPWLLTDAGSVFILDSVKDKQTKAAAFVQTAMDGGLELPGETWETCPFVPENGYGEVAVNLAIQNVELPEQGVTDVDAI